MSATTSGASLEAWSDQHPFVLERLREAGRWHADGRRVPYGMRHAFRWMRRQMRERVAGATGLPIIWLTVLPALTRDELCDWSCMRGGDVCDKTHVTPGKTLLQVRIATEQVLLSDFELWDRYVVRYQYVPTDGDDAARWDRDVRRALGARRGDPAPQLSSAWPERLVDRLTKSWNRIFDVGAGRPTQGTIERLKPSNVVGTMAPRVDDMPPWLRDISWSTYTARRVRC